jgi:Glutathione S-transferase
LIGSLLPISMLLLLCAWQNWRNST